MAKKQKRFGVHNHSVRHVKRLEKKINNLIIIGVISVAVIVIVALALLYFKPTVVGQAYRFDPETGTVVPGAQGDLALYFNYDLGYAENGDKVKIPIRLNNNQMDGVSGIAFCVEFDNTKLQVTNVGLDPEQGWSFFTENNVNLLNELGGANSCDVGFSRTVSIGAGASGEDIAGVDQAIGFIEFTVTGIPAAGGGATLITLKTPEISGTDPSDLDNPDSTSQIIVVHPCPDADGDGYASFGTDQVDGVFGSDMRACKNTNPFADEPKFDCKDSTDVDPDLNGAAEGTGCPITSSGCNAGNSKCAVCIYKGAVEYCDGKDNDCDDEDHNDNSPIDPAFIDEGLENEGLNVPPENKELVGVCLGFRGCYDGVTKNSWENNLVDDPNSFNDPYYGVDLEVCDFQDNNCDGQINEGLVCDFGGSSGLPFDAGNLFVDGWLVPVDDEAQPDDNNQPINYIDATIVSLHKEFQDAGLDVPFCGGFGAGTICVCNTGRYCVKETPGDGDIDYCVGYELRTKYLPTNAVTYTLVNNVIQTNDEALTCT